MKLLSIATIATLAIACLATPVAAAPRVHPEGFSLDVPADWKFSETSMTMGTRWNMAKVDPKDDKVGVILSVYVVTETEVESMIKDLGQYHKIPDLTWAPAQKTTFDGIPGTKRSGKAKSYDFSALTLETSGLKRIVIIAVQLGGDRQQRLELDLLINSLRRVPIKTTTFPLGDGVTLDVPTAWGQSKTTAPAPFNGMEWMLFSNKVEKAPKIVIYARAIDKDKLDAGIKAIEDEDAAELGKVAWDPQSSGTINGVRVTMRQGKQAGTPITLVVVETSATSRYILWAMPISADPVALAPELKAVLGSLRRR